MIKCSNDSNDRLGLETTRSAHMRPRPELHETETETVSVR